MKEQLKERGININILESLMSIVEDKYEQNETLSWKSEIFSKLEEYEINYFKNNSFTMKFPSEILKLTEADFLDSKCERTDFRQMQVFTIDGDNSKDFDDAVSLTYDNGIYSLGVHIADVSEYVRIGSPINDEVMKRGTSVYFPNMVVNMLPPILSENLCSLKPDCDRKTLSALIKLDSLGNVLDFSITKGLICSQIRGFYSEVDSVLSQTASDEVSKKYADVKDTLFLMKELAEKLRQKRVENGAITDENSNEPDIIFHEDSMDLIPQSSSESHKIIEEFMIICNHYVSCFMRQNNLPMIYRVQKSDDEMARYIPNSEIHSSLSLNCYTHFTSPIRRLADLRNHQVLSAYLLGCSSESLHFIFDKLIEESCERATKRGRFAKDIQKSIRRKCYVEYYRSDNNRHTGTVIANVKSRSLVKLDETDVCVICDTLKCVGQKVSVKVYCIDSRLQGYDLAVA